MFFCFQTACGGEAVPAATSSGHKRGDDVFEKGKPFVEGKKSGRLCFQTACPLIRREWDWVCSDWSRTISDKFYRKCRRP